MEWASLTAMRSLISAVLLMSCFGFGQAQETPPDIDGYVTSVTSANDFAVEGTHVVCDAKTHYRIGNGQWPADGTGFLVPGLDLMWLGGSIARSNIEQHNQERSARVSLRMLQDAQYDLSQAPLAWWPLASSKPKDLTNVTIPEHARYLHEVLGTTWKTGQMAIR